jgi:hypothetical protein
MSYEEELEKLKNDIKQLKQDYADGKYDRTETQQTPVIGPVDQVVILGPADKPKMKIVKRNMAARFKELTKVIRSRR